jgi:ABC-type arginine/histidine transport system permease subunit
LDVDLAATAIASACKLPAAIAIAPSSTAGLFQQFTFFMRSTPLLTKTIILIAGQYSKKNRFVFPNQTLRHLKPVLKSSNFYKNLFFVT